MKIAHFSDLHYSTKHLEIVDRAFSSAVEEAIDRGAEAAVISGDLFDAAINLHEAAVHALIVRVNRLASYMPVLILQGTFSHDRPGALDVFKHLDAPHGIYVADKPCRVYLDVNGQFTIDAGLNDRAVFCCLPSLNKAAPEIQELGPRGYVEKLLLDDWFAENFAQNIPRILVSHGTVTGCVTESRYAMISPDHEFELETLFGAGCKAVMLGHIHKHQSWSDELSGAVVAYAGSITRLVFGHHDPVGWLLWDVSADGARFEFMATPAPRLVEITFDGPPDMDELDALAFDVEPEDHVRIRYVIDQDYAHAVDKDEIKRLFAHVAVLKIEGTINPVESVRAAGIGRVLTIDEKLNYWAETTGDRDKLPALVDRLHRLKSSDVDAIVGDFKL